MRRFFRKGGYGQKGMGRINTDPFYKTKRWDKLRGAALKRDGYQCQYNKCFGRLVPATIVHHVLPRSIYPEYQYEMWNLISLSKSAHEMMHNRSGTELSDKGKKLAIRICRKYHKYIPEGVLT